MIHLFTVKTMFYLLRILYIFLTLICSFKKALDIDFDYSFYFSKQVSVCLPILNAATPVGAANMHSLPSISFMHFFAPVIFQR